MARERYLLNGDEETIHENVITDYTKKDKALNWWYYNKMILLAVAFCVIVGVSIVCSIVFKVRPDYTIAMMNEVYMDTAAVQILEEHIAEYGEDLNGDGQVIVSLLNYAVASSSSDSAFDIQSQQAAYAKYAADMSTGESMIWFHDIVGYHSMGEVDGVFAKISGDEVMIDWSDVPGLANTDFSSYNNDIITSDDMSKIFATLRVSIRETENSFIEKNEELMKYHTASEKLLQNLISDTKTVA